MADEIVQEEAEARDPALTIRPKRLAGSPNCLNCGTPLSGPYCHYCGQPDRRFRRVLPVLLRDLLADLADLDSRFLRTLLPLLLRPGRLTADYLDGRRFRYTPPMRLYLFSSLAFFVIAALTGMDRVDAGDGKSPVIVVNDGQEEGEDRDWNINLNGERWDRQTNPVAIPSVPGFVNDWINDEIEESPAKVKEVAANPNLFFEKMFDLLPGTMFLLLPAAALLFQFWHLFTGRYFVEHLIFALHAHAFTFVAMSLILVFGRLQALSLEQGIGWAAVLAATGNALVIAWVPFYFLLAIKQVYQQGWLLATVKFFAIGFCYAHLLAFTSAFVAVLGFLLL